MKPGYGCLAAVAAALALAGPARAAAQGVAVSVRVSHDGRPVDGAAVETGGSAAVTGVEGTVRLRLVPGTHELRVSRIGFAPATRTVEILAGRDTVIRIDLVEAAVEEDAIVVVSTRGERRIEDEPLRVEVVTGEEIEEKLLMTPGSIAMLLNETAGLRVQETSPTLGGASIRVQGLRGRYTQLLADGLPLYGGQSGALSLLQIPPMDLAQVEVIKGAASALYGSTALGGVVNLISKRPAGPEREALINLTTNGGTDALLWLADSIGGRWSYTLLGGAHAQNRIDADGDGWSDVPRYRRASVRPRVRYDNGSGRSLMVTAGVMSERRNAGGRVSGIEVRRFLDTDRLDIGLSARSLVGGARLFDLRASASRTAHDHGFGDARERDRHSTAFLEASLRGGDARTAWVVGGALGAESYASDDVPVHDYRYRVPSVFAQLEHAPIARLVLAASARLDRHSAYGSFLSPRGSALLRLHGPWSLRLSAGGGYFAPTPFTDETEDAGLRRVEPTSGLAAERAWSASADLGGVIGPLELNATLFGSVIRDAIGIGPGSAPGSARVFNRPGDTRTRGGELLARFRRGAFVATASHTRILATEPAGDGRRPVPLTPSSQSGLIAALEEHGTGRAGIEIYHTGRQDLEDDPYRAHSRPYLIVGMLFERRLGPLRAFLNLENLTGVRQTRWDPFVRPVRGPWGQWTVDEWAPLEGRVFNGGVRFAF